MAGQFYTKKKGFVSNELNYVGIMYGMELKMGLALPVAILVAISAVHGINMETTVTKVAVDGSTLYCI